MWFLDQYKFCWCWLPSISDIVFHWNHTNVAVVYSISVLVATLQTHIPGTWYCYVITNVNIVVLNQVGLKPLEVIGDMQTDDDDDRPEKYHKKPNSSVGNGEGQVDEDAGEEEGKVKLKQQVEEEDEKEDKEVNKHGQ